MASRQTGPSRSNTTICSWRPAATAIRGAREHNLKNVDLDLPRDKLVVLTGLSGSGKSSLAFDTIYAEGQRRYVESLSAYARQFLEMMQKPDVDQIDGLSPAISIEQKTTSKNPRSTVGTVTEIYDYMRLLWARVGMPYSPATGLPIESQTVSQMVDRVWRCRKARGCIMLAPVVRGRKGEYKQGAGRALKKGFQRVKIDGSSTNRRSARSTRSFKHDIDVVVDRIVVRADIGRAWRTAFETSLKLADGIAIIELPTSRSRRKTRRKKVANKSLNDKTPSASVFGKVRLPGLRLHHSRDRAAAVLLQQPLWRLPDLRRPRRRAEDRRRPDRARPGADAAQRRHRALGQVVLALLRADAGSARQASRLQADTKPWNDLPKKAQNAILHGTGMKIEVPL
jgi:excinuclease ABC subunit A